MVDDDPWLRGVMVELLAEEGFLPLEAATGPEAARVARQHAPSVIVLDVALPGRSGLDVLEELRASGSTRDIPVLLVSGEIDLVDTGHAHEADAAFHKPLDVGALLARVDAAARR